MGDGEQGNAGVLGRLEDLAFYVNAHSAGALIQEGVLGPGRTWGAKALGVNPPSQKPWPAPPPTVGTLIRALILLFVPSAGWAQAGVRPPKGHRAPGCPTRPPGGPQLTCGRTCGPCRFSVSPPPTAHPSSRMWPPNLGRGKGLRWVSARAGAAPARGPALGPAGGPEETSESGIRGPMGPYGTLQKAGSTRPGRLSSWS